MTLNFAAAPVTKTDELLKDLQEKVSSGKVGAFSVDSAHILNLEPEVVPTPQPDVQDSRDDGLFAVAVVTAVLLSLILGFVLGLTFHGQVVKRCVRSSRDPESCDGPNKTVEGVKYTKSPPRDENFTRNKNETRSKRKLLKKKGKNVKETEDTDSDSSTAGKIGQEEGGNQKDSSTSSSPSKSISPSVVIAKFAKKKPSPKNGKIPNVC